MVKEHQKWVNRRIKGARLSWIDLILEAHANCGFDKLSDEDFRYIGERGKDKPNDKQGTSEESH